MAQYTLKCPECDYTMAVKGTRTSTGPTGKAYNWTQYWCKGDDIWIELEVPKEEKE